ncbi:MAG: hypothetical protein A2542_01900 [Parcubacteria group bacterium RIFOXYD2_FULL_52_8]|nr:MAG: hypothetical protein A2542_01900 [Parcubacteria group bacterium RIFOXYD2_FULL_52_8]
MSLIAKIEALLLYKAEPQSRKAIAAATEATVEEVEAALCELKEKYAVSGSGIALVDQGTTVALATAPELHAFIVSLTKADDERELGAAALETLALILYQAPISRSAIDRIRGVNASYILRHLVVRGLIQRSEDPASPRSYVYVPTSELLAYLGLRDTQELPDKEKLAHAIATYLHATGDTETTGDSHGTAT